MAKSSILANSIRLILLESALFFINFVTANKAVLQRGKVP